MRLTVIGLFAAMAALAGLRSLPPLDRDEARFAQATAQMLESGDFIAIRFQEDERNKKPAGIHWLQAASVAAFSDVDSREIWAYRLPSMLGAVLAALFTYLAAARLYGPQTGLLAGLLLASAPVFAGEANIAKTDAMLLACVCAAQAAFIHVFARWKDEEPASYGWPFVFWIALGAGVLIKGPIAPLIVFLTAACFFARAREPGWVLALKPILGVFILVLMITPWAVAVGVATEGRFYAEAFGGDMLGKIGKAQESHAGPPGYHLLLLAALFWPAAALIAPAFIQAWSTRRAWPAWFLLSWIVPAWLVFEVTATKLPHYTLPLYPAIAILAARAASIGSAARRPLVRRLGASVYFIVALIGAGAIVALPFLYGGAGALAGAAFLAALIVGAAGFGAVLFWAGRCYEGGLVASLAGLLLAWAALNAVLPRLERLEISPRLSRALDDEGLHPLKDGAPPVALAGYSEPSAVFLLGTQTELTDGAGAFSHLMLAGGAAVVEARQEDSFRAAASREGRSIRGLATIEGLNYSNGREMRLVIYRLSPR
ncbi:MAG: glycosyltransferase family 39 protein [Parvularculaceae bacterium]